MIPSASVSLAPGRPLVQRVERGGHDCGAVGRRVRLGIAGPTPLRAYRISGLFGERVAVEPARGDRGGDHADPPAVGHQQVGEFADPLGRWCGADDEVEHRRFTHAPQSYPARCSEGPAPLTNPSGSAAALNLAWRGGQRVSACRSMNVLVAGWSAGSGPRRGDDPPCTVATLPENVRNRPRSLEKPVTRDKAAPPGIDVTVPSVARVYDYFLGGKDNFEVDRKVAEHALRITPDGPAAGQANRAFLRRVIRFLVTEAGIDQFLDIGSGLPTQGNVHEVAVEHNPAARVVYVDNDPIVLAHGRALLAAEGTATVIQADIREPEEILNDPDVRRFLDFDRPIGLLLFAILHHIGDDEDPRSVAAALIDALPSGSYVAISHFRDPGERDPEGSRKAREVERVFNESLGTGRWRTDEEILSFADGLTVLDPGLVPLAEWRPDPDAPAPQQTDTYHTFVGLLARKP